MPPDSQTNPCRLIKVFSYAYEQRPEEGQRTQWLKCFNNNKKADINKNENNVNNL